KPSYTDLVLSGGNIEYPVTENSIISNSFNSVQVKYTDITSGIHFAPNITSIALYDPDNNLITGNHSYIGQGDDRVCRWAFQDPNAIILDGTKDGIYTIKLKATDKAGNSFSKDISFNVISIIPPQNLNTYLDAVHNIHISWNNPNPNRKKNNSRSVGNYQIFRKIDESEFVQIAQTANLYYIDNLQEANDGTYTYMVKALYTIPGNSQIIPSDGTISDPIILKRFTPCTFNITLSDNQQASNILFHLLGNDGLYNQELNMTTNQSGVISLPAIYMTDYLLTLSKEGYQTIVDTISIDLATNEFTYILQKIDRQQGGRPDNYALYQNFPNPFNPTTEIRFALKSNSFVDLAVYNVKGQKIKQLHNQNLEYGYHKVVWDGKDNSDKKVSSGIYFYILNVRSNEDSYKEIRKMLMVK
ncbi:MAG: FlgD immunoglobulin-like domain containing protein, partial [Candidatus Cloacimonadales bacterium]